MNIIIDILGEEEEKKDNKKAAKDKEPEAVSPRRQLVKQVININGEVVTI